MTEEILKSKTKRFRTVNLEERSFSELSYIVDRLSLDTKKSVFLNKLIHEISVRTGLSEKKLKYFYLTLEAMLTMVILVFGILWLTQSDICVSKLRENVPILFNDTAIKLINGSVDADYLSSYDWCNKTYSVIDLLNWHLSRVS